MPVLQGTIEVVNLNTGILRLIVQNPTGVYTNYDCPKHITTINLTDNSIISNWITLELAGNTKYSFLCGQVVGPNIGECSELYTIIYQYIYNLLVIEENGVAVGAQTTLNLIEGDNIYINAVNDIPNSKVNVTIAADDKIPNNLMLMGG